MISKIVYLFACQFFECARLFQRARPTARPLARSLERVFLCVSQSHAHLQTESNRHPIRLILVLPLLLLFSFYILSLRLIRVAWARRQSSAVDGRCIV